VATFLETKTSDFQTQVAAAPRLPGCYIYRDPKHKILYIGKAKILQNRVRSYFNNYTRVEEKIRVMLGRATSVEYITTDSEVEALILEASLIKKHKPPYNSMMVDDKSYAYVRIDKVNTSHGEYTDIPTISISREKVMAPNADYFGPYPNGLLVKKLLKRLRRIFPYCSAKVKVIIPTERDKLFVSKTGKPCFQAQIGLCNGACGGHATRAEYETNLRQIKRFFAGEKTDMKAELEKEMKAAAKERDYEKAAKARNVLQAIQYVGSNLRLEADIDEATIMAEKRAKRLRAQAELVSRLEFPLNKLEERKGFKMECYDISNIQGKFAVGSMVVFVDGEPAPQLYRRFKIRMKDDPNDFGMLQEMLTRRFNQYLKSQNYFQKHQDAEKALADVEVEAPEQDAFEAGETETVQDNEGFSREIPAELRKRMQNWKPDESFSELPDLMIIDGGKGQLSAVFTILVKFGLAEQLPLVGLAKREEEIFKVKNQFADGAADWRDLATFNDVGKQVKAAIGEEPFHRVLLPRRSESLYLVQRIRDEAHRFAITYHRKLRSASIL
jgi:excinuclease ABC subunit C